MVNTLYLPELREALVGNDENELREFCTALHPARTAEFMEGLEPDEAWRVLSHADLQLREQIFSYFERGRQVAIIETQDRQEVARLIADLPPDDRVDLLKDVLPVVVAELMPLLPADDRRDILRLQAYPDGTAGAMMTTQVAKLAENLTVKQALDELSHLAADLETIYYLYVVDGTNHLRGVVSARQLLVSMRRPDTRLGEIMESDVVTVNALDDQEDVAHVVARYDFTAIPVVDSERVMLGIITHDDVIDVVREEATEDAQRIAAVSPLENSYLRTAIFTLSWKRGIWLAILFVGGLGTAFSLRKYGDLLGKLPWISWFVPLVISSGGNSGSQSATLIITAMATGDVQIADWRRVLLRELMQGLLLGGFLGILGSVVASFLAPNLRDAAVVPLTLVMVVTCGTMLGSLLPILFRRLGLDPALMSNPFVSGIVDVLGILIYMTMATLILGHLL